MPEGYDDEDVIGVCGECKSDQPMHYMENSPFAAAGAPVPCKFCGGVVIIVYRGDRERALQNVDQSRGLGHSDLPDRP